MQWFIPTHYCYRTLQWLKIDLINSTIIVDNSPMSYKFHPENAIDCSSFLYDPKDVELWQIGDFLCGIYGCEDVRLVCRHWREWVKNNKSTVPK